MNQRNPDKVIPFAPPPREQRYSGDPVESSGQAIVAMLQEAVDVARENCDRAMDIAHKLSVQLRTAEDKIRQMESDLRHFQERATRAEQWLVRIHKEVEDKFFHQNGVARQGPPGHR